MKYDPTVWGPHYWFFLHTIAHAYPETPNAVTKRKYYDLIQNMPIFIPDPGSSDQFAAMLDRYPVTPYLDNRDSFMRWVHFIHNKFNVLLGREEMSLFAAREAYLAEYKPRPVYISEKTGLRKHVIVAGFVIVCGAFIYLYWPRDA